MKTAERRKKRGEAACGQQGRGYTGRAEKRDCRHCAYAGRVWAGRRILLICVNCPGRLGQLTCIAPNGICRSYRSRQKRAGRPPRENPVGDDVCFLALTQDKFGVLEARDFRHLRRYKWCACRCGRKYYVRRHGNGRGVWMHREIMHPPPGMVVDHIHGNGLNNCRRDLRVCTQLENGHNTGPNSHSSGFKGVSYHEIFRKWEAAICIRRRMVSIGFFATELEAARAYDRRAGAEFGIHAWLNFPREYPPQAHRRRRR